MLASSRKARAYASGPAFTWGPTQGPCYFLCCVGVCLCVGGGWSRHLDADAALQFELQTDHVHLAGGAKLLDLGHLLAHLVDGHFDGAQVGVVLVHHCDALLHVGETMSSCRMETHLGGAGFRQLIIWGFHFMTFVFVCAFFFFYSWGFVCALCIFPSSLIQHR